MILTIVLLFLITKSKVQDKFEAYLYAIGLWTLYCFSITEILSLMKRLNQLSLVLAWGSLALILAVLYIRGASYASVRESLLNYWGKLRRGYGIWGWGIFSVIMIISALKVIPYNWDSMTYHCARLFHWKQNMSISHFATGISRQVSSPLLGDLVNLNVYIITGNGSSILNLLQCFSYLANGVLVYNIARKLDLSKTNCIMATVLFYTTPIAVAEAFTTQVDNFATIWLLAFVYVVLDFLNKNERIEFDRKTIAKVCFLSVCVALGYMAKPSVGFGMLIFGIWLFVMTMIRKDKWSILIAYIGIAAIIILAILLPEWIRNIATFGALADQETGAKQLIGSLHPRHILVNMVKNIAFNLPSIWVYNGEKYIELFVRGFSTYLGIDIDNPVISENGTSYRIHAPQTYGCDTAVNPIITWLTLLSILFIIWKWKKFFKETDDRRRGYVISVIFSFFIFCALLRWEPFVSRYMISYLALLCPAICVVIEEIGYIYKGKVVYGIKSIIYFVCIVEITGIFIYAHENLFEKLTPTTLAYYRERYNVFDDYREAANYINDMDYTDIGLYIGGDSYEYPLIQMLNGERRVEHIKVDNKTSKYEDVNFIPSIIFVYQKTEPEDWNIKDASYTIVKRFENGGSLWVRTE